jgi:hypothetical protein
MDTINQHQTAAGTPVEPSNHPQRPQRLGGDRHDHVQYVPKQHFAMTFAQLRVVTALTHLVVLEGLTRGRDSWYP